MPYIGNITSDFSIDTGNITNRAVTATKLSPSSVGSNGQVLSVDGSGNLQWSADANAPEGTAVLSTGESGTTKYLRVDGDGTCSWQVPPNTQLSFSNDANNRVVTGTGSGLNGEANLTFDGSSLGVTGTTKITGNTSIGTTTQDWRFQVLGGRATFTDTTSYALGVRKNSTQGNNYNYWIGAAAADDTTVPDLVFSNNDGTERLRLDSNGDLGLGIAAVPQDSGAKTLHIHHPTVGNPARAGLRLTTGTSGSASSNGGFLGLDYSNVLYLYNQENGSLRIGTNGTERIRITNDGLVLLGTTNPSGYSSRKLTVAAASGGSVIEIRTSTTDAGQISFSDGYAADDTAYRGYIQYMHNGDYMRFATASTERLIITSTGNVGIGTSSPSATLHCLKSGQINLVVGSSNAGGAYLVLDGDSNGDSAGADYSYIGHTTSGDLELAVSNPDGNGNIYLKSNNFSYQAVTCHETGPVELRYQNGKRFETTSTGAILTSGAAGTTSCRFGNTANRGLEVNVVNNSNNDAGVVLNAADSENSGYAAYIAFQIGGEEKGRFEGQYDNFRLSNTCVGITFNGDYATANALNDYEEGTYSPTVTCATSGGYNLSTSYNTMAYRKIGSLVHIQGYISITSESGTPDGALRVSLPKTATALAQNADYTGIKILVRNHGSSNIYNQIAVCHGSGSYFNILFDDGNGASTYMTHSHVDTNWQFFISGSYIGFN